MKITKENIKNIAIGVLCTGIGTTFTFMALADGSDRFEHEQLYRETAQRLQIAQYEHCMAEQALVSDKLEDHYSGDDVLSNSDLDRLVAKSKNECAQPKAVVTIEEQKEAVDAMNQEVEFDIDALAYAVAVAETGNFTKGSGVSKLNGFGIMYWPNGVRTLKTYSSKEESIADFKRIWQKSYGGFPTRAMAVKWTGNDNADTWLYNVTIAYNKYINSRDYKGVI